MILKLFKKYMADNNILKTDFNEEVKIKDLKLNNFSYIVFCYDKKDFYHMVPIINNTVYDKNLDCLDLYVIAIYQKM